MTQKEHDELLHFTMIVCRKIFKSFKFDPQEVFYEAFSQNKPDIKNAIANEAYRSYLSQMADWVNKKKTTCIQKQCNYCKKTKDSSLFNKRFDKKHNLHYFRSECKECLSKKLKDKNISGLIDYQIEYKRHKKYMSNPVNRDKVNARRREWRQTSKSQISTLDSF